nr:reverse transcriptase domain-containing protein [Tanacetum cinerariifolium]
MTAHHNDWDTLAQQKITALKAEMAEINKNLMRVLQVNQQVKAVTPNCETCGGPHSFNDSPATVGQTQNVYAAGAYQGTLPGNTITNPKEELKGITTHSRTAYQGPTIPTTYSSLPPVTKTVILNSEPVVAPIIKPVVAPVSSLKPNQKPSIPYSSRLHDQKLRDKANDQRENFFQIFKDLNFNIRFADAFILIPKTLLTNKDKLSELARTPLNEHCSAVLLKKLPEKPGDPGMFLIPCGFPRMAEYLALADHSTSINLMPLSVWTKFSLPDMSPTYMTLELADRSISRPVGVAEDVFVKTERALINVFEGELTLRVGKYAIRFNLDQTSRYSANYNDMMAKRIDVIEVDALLALEDDPTSSKVDQSYVDTEGDILLLKKFLNDDPSLPPHTQGNYLPQVRKELKIYETKTDKIQLMNLPILNTYFWKVTFNIIEGLILKSTMSSRMSYRVSPPTSGQVEVSNRGLKRIIKRTVGENRASWLDKLDDALWALRTAYKTPIGCTPYKRVYRKACHLSIELEHKAYWALKHANFVLQTAGDHRKVQLNELNELRDQAYEKSLIYKEKTKRLHDSKIKDRVFNIGDRVLLFNSRLKIFSSKLKTRWSGPFTISHVYPYDTVELSQTDGLNFKVNGHRLKHYFGEDIPKMVVPNLKTFPKDQ